MKTLYTLKEYTQSYYDDWDRNVRTWDAEAKQVVDVMVWTTRFASVGTLPYKFEDATEEMRKAAKESWKAEVTERVIAQQNRSSNIETGCQVRFVKGYKKRDGSANIPVGAVGTVFWKGQNTFNYRTVTSFGIVFPDGSKVFVGIEKLEKCLTEERINGLVETELSYLLG